MTTDLMLPRAKPTKVKKCEFCGKKLSLYNENRFCFVHIYQGYVSDVQAEDARRQKNAKIMAKSRERVKK